MQQQSSASLSTDTGRFPAPASQRSRPAGPSVSISPDVQSSSEWGILKKTFPNGNSYVGTWNDGRMHGEGLYVWQDGCEYKGEFCNDVMVGKGEKRWPDGRCYRGMWKQDMMWGEGEMTWPTRESYSGQFWKGAYHGQGTLTKPSGDKYIGEFNNGEQEGKGAFRSAIEGWIFTGLWLHGRMYGEGQVEWPDGTVYVGQWKDGIRDGQGRLTWPDGAWYEGPFKCNHVEGYGMKCFPDGSFYEGEFTDGEFEGQGMFHWPDGTEFEGLWSSSEIVGPGCHRFPSGTTITGTFADCGASGEGEKQWTNGCIYNGILKQNRVDEYGTLKWPDGRCYIGQLHDGTLHGEGTLSWTDRAAECKYQGLFACNVFEGHGILEWSTGSRYEGHFHKGLYHGEGTFIWPERRSIYKGQWIHGELCGKGTLTCSSVSGDVSQYVYNGAFKDGHMEGRGHVVFSLSRGGKEEYCGKFKGSKFNGRGTFIWEDGISLTGLYEDNYCNRVGCKVYGDGRVYTGELRYDLEHGKGIVTEPQKKRFVGIWEHGRIVEELFDSCAPSVELKLTPCTESDDELDELDKLESPTSDCWNKQVSVQSRVSYCTQESTRIPSRVLLPIRDASGTPVSGRAIVNFLNGDKYVGYMQEGKKNGRGMYVYADLTMYKGEWLEDMLDGIRHPVAEDPLPVKVKHLTRAAVEHEKAPSSTVARTKKRATVISAVPADTDSRPPMISTAEVLGSEGE